MLPTFRDYHRATLLWKVDASRCQSQANHPVYGAGVSNSASLRATMALPMNAVHCALAVGG